MTTYLRSLGSIRSLTLGVLLAGGTCLGFLSCTLNYQELRALPDAAGTPDTRTGAGGSGPTTTIPTGVDANAGGAGGTNFLSGQDAQVDDGPDVPLATGGATGSGGSLATGGSPGSGGAFGAGGIDGATCGARDCTSTADNDCDGKPDNTTCPCKVGDTQACDSHAGLDGHGPCKAGSQTCIASADKSTSAWGTCTGSVGPAAADSCSAGDDANCNGVPNEGCSCVNGTTQSCGPTGPKGICKAGTSTCTNAAWGTCTGAVYSHPRDCTSSADNDCNGAPDNTETAYCGCSTPGETRTCLTGLSGICSSGTQTCTFSSDNTTSAWSACSGASAGLRDCRSAADNNCNGTPDKQEAACGCPTANQPQSCSTGLQGVCAAGSQTCIFAADYASSGWGTCTGASPGSRDCRSSADNNCNGTADNAESSYCKCATNGATQACNSHAQDGVGTCKAGTQTCVFASDHASSDWGSCSGDVGPVADEGCGPNQPDANCNGKAGDGNASNCTTTIYIKQYSSGGEISCSGGTMHWGNYASTDTGACLNGDECQVISTFKVFSVANGQPSGTVPLRNCRFWAAPSNYSTFVKIGSDCSTIYTGSLPESTTDLGVVGYVSTVAAAGYTRLNQTLLTISWYGHGGGYENFAYTPLTSCPSCVTSCTPSSYYVLP